LRYFDAHNDTAFADAKKLDYWQDVDLYLGGMEHTTLHLLYSRFWHQFLYDQKLVPTAEPYRARRGQGIILAADGTKMSKSKGNVVNPTEVIDSGYGADALRVAIAFIAPYDQTTPWSPEGVAGTFRFLQRIWTLVQEYSEALSQQSNVLETDELEKDILRVAHQLIKKVSRDVSELNFNTAIAAQMETVNQLYKLKESDHFGNAMAWKFVIESLLQLLAPFAPHLAEELWQQIGHEESVHTSQWPTFDEAYLQSDTMNIVVQVNGKVRSQLQLTSDSDEAATVSAAYANGKIVTLLNGKTIKKTVYVPGKLVNFVV
jgi:leucyl-tRNA synthetase